MLAYADDLALLVRGGSTAEVAQRAAEAAEVVCEWMDEVGMKIVPHKTECVMLVGDRAADCL